MVHLKLFLSVDKTRLPEFFELADSLIKAAQTEEGSMESRIWSSGIEPSVIFIMQKWRDMKCFRKYIRGMKFYALLRAIESMNDSTPKLTLRDNEKRLPVESIRGLREVYSK